MKTRFHLDILPQPDATTCGPTCLHAIYRYYGKLMELEDVVAEARSLDDGGTLAVFLACHALRHDFKATIYTYNLQVFDPTWFKDNDPADIIRGLKRQRDHKPDQKLQSATEGYLEFLELGGKLRFEDLTTALLRRYLNRSIPILAGLSATYLYRTAREFGPDDDYDDARGDPSGHFVVLCGYDREARTVLVTDPLLPNPVSKTHEYSVSIDRALCACLLGVLTYDANLLMIEPRKGRR